MDEKQNKNIRCFATKARGVLLLRMLMTILSTMLTGGMFNSPVLAQNPCDENGPDCRILTPVEVNAFKELVLKVEALLPVPNATRYKPDGAIEASSIPFVALTKIPTAIPYGFSWLTGCFPDYPYNTLLFGYEFRPAQKEPATKETDPLAAVQAMAKVIESKIELSVSLLPHAYLLYVEDGKPEEVPDPEAYNIDKSDEFLSWQTGDEWVSLHMIFGPRTIKEAETLRQDKPATRFAPLKSIELIISGPEDDVAALKKRIDRSAFTALLGHIKD